MYKRRICRFPNGMATVNIPGPLRDIFQNTEKAAIELLKDGGGISVRPAQEFKVNFRGREK